MEDINSIAILLVDGFNNGLIDAPPEYSSTHPVEGMLDYFDTARHIGYDFCRKLGFRPSNQEALMSYIRAHCLLGLDESQVTAAKDSPSANCVEDYRNAQLYGVI